MNEQELKQLGKIYNTLTLISTKWDDTITMAECLKALSALQQEMKNKPIQEGEETSREE